MNPFFYTDIPTWDNGTWTITSFTSREEFRNFVLSIFKEPGKYNFDETSFIFNEDVKEILKKSLKDKKILTVIDVLTYFSRCNFFVIKNEHSGIISLDYLLEILKININTLMMMRCGIRLRMNLEKY
jgi:hypothetical protein